MRFLGQDRLGYIISAVRYPKCGIPTLTYLADKATYPLGLCGPRLRD